MKENTFLKKVNAIRKAATKSGVVASSPLSGAVKQAKFIGGVAKKGVKHLDDYYKEQDRLRAVRDWHYQKGDPNASDYDLSGPPKSKRKK